MLFAPVCSTSPFHDSSFVRYHSPEPLLPLAAIRVTQQSFFFLLDPLHVINMSQSHHDAVASSLQQFLDKQHISTSAHESGNSQSADATPYPHVLHAQKPPRGRIDATPSDDSSSTDLSFTTASLSNSEPPRNNVGFEGYGFRPASGASSPAALNPPGTGSSTPIPDPHGLGWPGMSPTRSISLPLVYFIFSFWGSHILILLIFAIGAFIFA